MATTIPANRPLELSSSGVLSSTPKPQLDALTGIRFIAAVLVVVAHIEMLWHMAALAKDSAPAFAAWSARGDAELLGIAMPGYPASESVVHFLIRGVVLGAYVALDIFFILSGFVLTYTCTSEDGKIRINRAGFWATRFARVYPVFLVGLFFSFLLFLITTTWRQPPITSGERGGMMLATLLLLQAWWPDAANAWNPPAWSLSVEAFFYVLFPFLLLWVDRLKRSQLWSLLALSYAAMLIPSTIYYLLRPDGAGYDMSWLGDGTWLKVIKYNPLIRLPEFISGMILGKLFAHKAVLAARDGEQSRGWLAAIALVGMFAGMCLTYYMPYPIMHNGILMPFVALLIYDLAMGGGLVGRFFASRPMVLLGNSTYCVYILHAGFLGYGTIVIWFILGGEQTIKYEAEKQARQAQITSGAPAPPEIAPPDLSKIPPDKAASPMSFLFWVSATCLVASIMMHKFFEEPCRRYLRRKLSRRAHLAIPPPTKAADLP